MSFPPLVPVVLEGCVVRLEPLSLDHLPALCRVGLDPELFRWTPRRTTNEAEMRSWIETALAQHARGVGLPFAVVHRASGQVVGSTRFMEYAAEHGRTEIGWTWYARAYQRTGVNTESKFMLLSHAFEKLGLNRVEFKTDALNEASRRALLRIGATQEGILRHHMLMPDGRWRDSVYFSVIAAEWPEVKRALETKLR